MTSSVPSFDCLPRGLVEPIVLTVGLGQRQFLLADDDQVAEASGFSSTVAPCCRDQLRRIAPRHAGQLADKGHALVLEEGGGSVYAIHWLQALLASSCEIPRSSASSRSPISIFCKR